MNPFLLVVVLVSWIGLGMTYGFVRTAIAIGMFFGIFWLGTRKMHRMTTAPPEPDVEDISNYGLTYVCSVCGLRLKVEVAAHDKPPTHCMEPMRLERAAGQPPLRPHE